MTPVHVSRYKPSYSSSCPLCLQQVGTFFHLIWLCPVVQSFLIHMTTCLTSLDPKACLLVIFPVPDINTFLTAFFCMKHYSLLVKVIAHNWMQATPTLFVTWVQEVNSTLPYKKLIYSMSTEDARLNTKRCGTDG